MDKYEFGQLYPNLNDAFDKITELVNDGMYDEADILTQSLFGKQDRHNNEVKELFESGEINKAIELFCEGDKDGQTEEGRSKV